MEEPDIAYNFSTSGKKNCVESGGQSAPKTFTGFTAQKARHTHGNPLMSGAILESLKLKNKTCFGENSL